MSNKSKISKNIFLNIFLGILSNFYMLQGSLNVDTYLVKSFNFTKNSGLSGFTMIDVLTGSY
jgi:hypothetical protein